MTKAEAERRSAEFVHLHPEPPMGLRRWRNYLHGGFDHPFHFQSTQADKKRGPVDKESFVGAMNEDLGTEYQSIIQYTNHVATITGAEFLSVIDELKVHLSQELAHAQILAEQVAFLGGTPTTGVPPVETASDSRSALAADLRLETNQLERYRQRFAQANELGLADVAEAIRPLLEQTQEHVRDLQTALGE